MVPDEVRLRQARELLRGIRAPAYSAPALFALERHVAAADGDDPVWRSISSGVAISLAEAVACANLGAMMATEPLLLRVSLPRDIDSGELDGGDAGKNVPGHLLPVVLRPAEKRALDLLADWPWLARQELAGLLGVSNPRASQLTAALERLDLATAVQLDARYLALTNKGLKLLARRDRVSTGEARQRWSVCADGGADGDRPKVSGRRSRQLLRDLEHTAAVHRFTAALARQVSRVN